MTHGSSVKIESRWTFARLACAPLACAGMVLACSLGVAPALAQPANGEPAPAQPMPLGGVGRAIVEADQLTPEQRQAVDKLVSDNRAALGSTQAEEVMRARQALLAPMLEPQVTIGPAYRTYFSSQMVPVLTPLVAETQQNDQAAINALVIAGETGTQPASQLLIGALKSKSASVRRAAAYGMQRTFLGLTTSQPAIAEGGATQLLAAAQQALTSEADPHVAVALVQACLDASRLRGANGQFNLGNQAIEAVCRAFAARASVKGSAALDMVEVQAALSAIVGARDFVGGRAGVNVPSNVHVAASELAGAVAAHGRRVLNANGLPLEDAQRRELYAQASDAAVTLVQLAGEKLQPDFRLNNPNLGAALRKGTKLDDGAFLKGVDDVVGVLTRAPFNLNAATLR